MRNMLRATAGSLGLVTVVLFLCVGMSPAHADPCLMVYPESGCYYHYDPAEYYTVGFGDPLYDPMYDRGGQVLIDINTDEIALDVYQAPGLLGFVMDVENQGYFTIGTEFDLIVDGYNNEPIVYTNVLLVFDRIEPEWCEPNIWVDGNPVMYDADLGWYYPIGALDVSTPLPHGNSYSDTVTHSIMWEVCYGMRIYAFSDENHNLIRDGGECFSAFSHDTTVPTKESTWGAVKALFTD
ncbi:MAG: hypothetical protein JSW50_13555 [Candidatus Latescibacterota bacterium]|nr:MAG: hypothetical protein JSW50_13555 [Candidatus Latescibacterota bacterium]